MGRGRVAWFFSSLVALASFLLFEIELIEARRLLPIFGSSAAVWTTALMFYQGALFVGYLWGAAAARRIGQGGYRWIHVLLIAAAAACFPFGLWAPDLPPVLAVVVSLAATLGPPFVALSTTSVVAQSWWRRTGHPQAEDPWFLYGASNGGALLALLAYPTVVEPRLGLADQLSLWYAGYAVFVALHVPCILAVGPAPAASPEAVEGGGRPSPSSIGVWVSLAAGASAMLMAITNVVTVDAPIPLLWVIPLALYLVTLVWTFGPRPPSPAAVNRAGMGAVALSVVALGALITGMAFQLALIALGDLILFVACLRAHYALVQARPRDAGHLGIFYLCVALGGWLGSVVIAAVVPVVASSWPTFGVDCLVAGAILLGGFLLRDSGAAWRLLKARWPLFAAGALALSVLVASLTAQAGSVHGSRTFYGIYRVQDDGALRRFVHGNTVHGYQYLDPARAQEPLAYFHRQSPVGRVLTRLGPEAHEVAIVGLGAGILSAYGQEGQRWDLYELDPEVATIAQRFFTYLKASPATIRLILGDGRLTLAKTDGGPYDLLVLDTFSSDFVPTHLLTVEAVDLYLEHLAPGGVLLLHITNRIFDLAPPLADLCAARRLRCATSEWQGATQGELDSGRLATTWFAMSRDESRVTLLTRGLGWEAPPPGRPGRAWTDDRTDLLSAVRWGED